EAARETGVADLVGPPSLTAGPAPAVRPAPPSTTTSGWQTGTATRARTQTPNPAPAPPAGSGVSDFFSGLFGGGNSAPTSPTPPAEPSIGQSWSSATQVKKGN